MFRQRLNIFLQCYFLWGGTFPAKCSCVTCNWSICLHGLCFFKYANMPTVDSRFEQPMCDHYIIISSKHSCVLVYWFLVTLVYVPSLGICTFKIQCINVRVLRNILKCPFLCLRLAFNLFMLNVDQSVHIVWCKQQKSAEVITSNMQAAIKVLIFFTVPSDI